MTQGLRTSMLGTIGTSWKGLWRQTLFLRMGGDGDITYSARERQSRGQEEGCVPAYDRDVHKDPRNRKVMASLEVQLQKRLTVQSTLACVLCWQLGHYPDSITEPLPYFKQGSYNIWFICIILMAENKRKLEWHAGENYTTFIFFSFILPCIIIVNGLYFHLQNLPKSTF